MGQTSNEFLIKVCGITRVEDALMAVDLGANALGYNFYSRSPRFIAPGAAREIISSLRRHVVSVGVVVMPSPEDPWRDVQTERNEAGPDLSQLGFLDALQVHGAASRADLPATDLRVIAAVSPELVESFPGCEIIVDTSWGTGKLADLDLVRRLDRPFILSGGLNPDNVTEILRQVSPAGIDVCSGVESEPGIKDPAKLKRFLQLVAEWRSEGYHAHS